MPNPSNTAFAERLNLAMNRAGLEISDLSEQSEISYEMIRRYTHGIAKPRDKGLKKIAECLSVSASWLDYGEGEMPSAQAQVDELVASMPNGITYDQVEPWRRQINSEVYDVQFCCGDGAGYAEFEPLKKTLPFDESFFTRRRLKPENFKIIYAKGDSMAHYIQEGDAVGLDISDKIIKDGEVYALFLDGDTMIKRIFREAGGRLTLSSDNKNYRDKIVDESNGESLIIIGRVVYRSG